MWHVRLTPKDEKLGALCERLSVGGQLFKAGHWYNMRPEVAEKLRPLKQDSGANFFQIVESDEEWHEVVREELARAMAGPEAAAMARFFAQSEPAKAALPKKRGEVKQSMFEGLEVEEVSKPEIGDIVAEGMSMERVAQQLVPSKTPQVSPDKKKKSPKKRGKKSK